MKFETFKFNSFKIRTYIIARGYADKKYAYIRTYI